MLVKESEIDTSHGIDEHLAVYRFKPNGIDTALQRMVTELMHSVAMESNISLAELGYLHLNTFTYSPEKNRYFLRVYFDAELATRKVASKTSSSAVVLPVKEMQVFKNFLYVGDILDVIDYDDIDAPKHQIISDELGRPSIRFKDMKKTTTTKALVLNCNIPVTMAAGLGLDILDKNFGVKPVLTMQDRKKASMNITNEVPVGIIVKATYYETNIDKFNTDDVEKYINRLMNGNEKIKKNKQKLDDKVEKKIKKLSDEEKERIKKKKRNDSKGYGRFS